MQKGFAEKYRVDLPGLDQKILFSFYFAMCPRGHIKVGTKWEQFRSGFMKQKTVQKAEVFTPKSNEGDEERMFKFFGAEGASEH